MPTYWHKRDWWPSDLDRTNPYKPEIVPGALPPGIYCEDEDGYRALLASGKVHADLAAHSMFDGKPEEDRPLGWMFHTLGGIRIRVVTPAEAKILRAMPARSPEEALAEQHASLDAADAEMKKLVDLMAPKPAPRPAPPPPATRHPFRGANRAQRRAAEAKRRRA
ncbi:hypothetical protein GOFOIKOB_4536 [Methylobacterium tardum]|uniref:Uncharacterized protein n=1 Tax=Methylobacterium tardum TaxID=374432 RepID=A0AA37TGK2_9HYPH|nr:hypothetical protein [Methylobacterium tardum]URD39442.1 hypothetical protein M6G65_14155 [Methylobacterium tardum]GJE51477.1 hypothetical protein GOFOIKOB_4536 [Methylobacterium tardum]GLS73626.1 hypothetical protein GCM10007890_56410 [Methylobacterium tardum]